MLPNNKRNSHGTCDLDPFTLSFSIWKWQLFSYIIPGYIKKIPEFSGDLIKSYCFEMTTYDLWWRGIYCAYILCARLVILWYECMYSRLLPVFFLIKISCAYVSMTRKMLQSWIHIQKGKIFLSNTKCNFLDYFFG